MRKFLTLIFIFLSFSVSSAKIENIDDPFLLFEQEKHLNELYYQIQGMFLDGLYKMVIKKGKEYLQNASEDDERLKEIIKVVTSAYLYTDKPDELYQFVQKYGKYLSRDLIVRVVIYLQKKEKYNYVKSLFRKYKFLNIENRHNYKKIKGFELGKNIFILGKNQTVFGENDIYISYKNQTLLEVAKEVDMGYYELKIANPDVNPFDIKKGQMILLPRRRIIPEMDYNLNTIYINLTEKRLYYPTIINKKYYVITFPVGIGTDDTGTKVGEFQISQKRRNPIWYVPENIRKENPELPKAFPPGEDNPLGTRAMRLDHTMLLIHGTNKEFGIGMKVSHGCIRMYNPDVERLFDIVEEGTSVKIVEKAYKFGVRWKKFYIEIDTEKDINPKEIKEEMKKLNIDTSKYQDLYKIKLLLIERGYAIPFK